MNPAVLSKINWTNIIAAGATLLTIFGIDLTPEAQMQIVTGIALASQLLSIVFRTWFTAKP